MVEKVRRILTHEILRSPVWGWLIMFAVMGFLVYLAIIAAPDTCHLTGDGLDCGR